MLLLLLDYKKSNCLKNRNTIKIKIFLLTSLRIAGRDTCIPVLRAALRAFKRLVVASVSCLSLRLNSFKTHSSLDLDYKKMK